MDSYALVWGMLDDLHVDLHFWLTGDARPRQRSTRDNPVRGLPSHLRDHWSLERTPTWPRKPSRVSEVIVSLGGLAPPFPAAGETLRTENEALQAAIKTSERELPDALRESGPSEDLHVPFAVWKAERRSEDPDSRWQGNGPAISLRAGIREAGFSMLKEIERIMRMLEKHAAPDRYPGDAVDRPAVPGLPAPDAELNDLHFELMQAAEELGGAKNEAVIIRTGREPGNGDCRRGMSTLRAFGLLDTDNRPTPWGAVQLQKSRERRNGSH